MKLVADNTNAILENHTESTRDRLLRYTRGELHCYSFRVFKKDGTYQDIAGGWTKEDQLRVRAEVLNKVSRDQEG